MGENDIDSLYTLIEDLVSREELTCEMQQLQQEYEGLIDDEAAAMLIVDRYGRNTLSTKMISELSADMDCTLKGVVTTIESPRTFKRKNGREGRVCNLILQDSTGVVALVLWNDDVEQVTSGEISVGDTLTIINGYCKTGYTGELQLTVGRWSTIEKNTQPTTSEEEPSLIADIRGILIDKQSTQAHLKNDGSIDFTSIITIKTKNERTPNRVIITGEHVKRLKDLPLGSVLMLEGIQRDGNQIRLHPEGNISSQG